MRRMNYRSSVSAPIVVAGILWGAVGIASAEPLPADTEARLGAFWREATNAEALAANPGWAPAQSHLHGLRARTPPGS